MMVTGPILLNKLDEETQARRRELSFLQWSSLQPIRFRRKKSVQTEDDVDANERVNYDDDQVVYGDDDDVNTRDDESDDKGVRKQAIN